MEDSSCIDLGAVRSMEETLRLSSSSTRSASETILTTDPFPLCFTFYQPPSSHFFDLIGISNYIRTHDFAFPDSKKA